MELLCALVDISPMEGQTTISNPMTTYVSNLGQIDPGVYRICMTTPSAPFTSQNWTHTLQDNITRGLAHDNILFSR